MGDLIIPKVFHRIWLGEKKMPDEFERYGETWIKHHPDWEIITWNEKNIIPLINQECYDNCTSVVGKADIARPELVYKLGGIYVDCDFECFKNIEPLLEGVEAFVTSETPSFVTNSFIGGCAGNPFFERIVKGIPESIRQNSHLTVNFHAGPHYYTRLLKEFCNVTVLKQEHFFPYPYEEKHRKGEVFPNAYAAHHWAASWM